MGSYDEQNERWAQERAGRGGENIPTEAGQRGYSEYQKEQQNQYGGGGGSCFISSTPILTPTGWRPMASLVRGDRVMTFDASNRVLKARPLTKRIDHAPVAVWRLRSDRLTSGVGTTRCHAFLTARGWVRASKVHVGDVLTAVDEFGNIVEDRITASEPSFLVEPVHNLLTPGEHTYLAGGFVVHNFSYFRRLRTMLHRVMDGQVSVSVNIGKVPELRPTGE